MELVAVLRSLFKLRFRNFPLGDFGGRGNIGCADHIGMVEMATLATQKDSTNKTIAFFYMPALRARPARVSRIDGDHRNAGRFRFVFNEPSKFGERPFRHPVPLSFPEPYPLADACQFFNSNAAIRACGFLNDPLRDAMVGVRLESTLPTGEVSQLAPDLLGTFSGSFPLGRFLLKGAARLSIVLSDFFDFVAGVDFTVAVSGDIHNPEINANEVGYRYRCFVWHINSNQQKPLPVLPPNEIGLPLVEAESLTLALSHQERHDHATFERQQRDAINVLERHDATVIGHGGVFSENGLDILVPAVGSANMANAERGHLRG